MTDNAPTPHPEDQQDTYTDLTARLAAADLGWSHEHGDPPANPDYIKRLAFQVMAFKPPLIAGVYVDELPDGFSPKDFAVAVGALMRDAQEAILVDMLGGLDPNDEWRRMARNAAKAAVKIAVQRGWRPVQ